MKKSITFVGLDVHKNSIAVALADAGRNAEVRNYGIIGGGLDDLGRLVKKLEKLMAFLGLIPSEHSSGETKKRGKITKTGNGHARRVLVEGAQSYSFPARMTRLIGKRQEGLSQEVRDIAWKCQVRLCARFRRLVERGKSCNAVVTAIARELAAFMWAIANKTPIAN